MLGVLLIAAVSVAPQQVRPLETFTCPFPKAGTVIIDTRTPGSTITVRGKRWPAESGSYFYGTRNGEVVVYFTPKMDRWTFADTSETVRCSRRQNVR